MGGKFHLMLNIGERPIANKYCEGKMKRTLKRELKVPEIAGREANGIVLSAEIRDCESVSIFLHRKGKRCGSPSDPLLSAGLSASVVCARKRTKRMNPPGLLSSVLTLRALLRNAG